MIHLHKHRWLALLACLFTLSLAPMRAQEVDDLQEYLDKLAAQQTAQPQPKKGIRKVETITVPVGLTEVDLSKFTSYQNRTKGLTLKASVKFTNGTITAASTYSGGECLLKVYDGATVVLDASAGVNAGATTSSKCLAAVGIYGGSTFYQCGDITAPSSGTGIAIYIDGATDTYNYVSGTTKGSISNANGGTVNGLETSKEAYAVLSTDRTTLSFYYDGKKDSREGTVYTAEEFRTDYLDSWGRYHSNITTVVFDASFADYDGLTNTTYWFGACSNLKQISGIENLKTKNVTDMSLMFSNCSNLMSLDVSGFDTGNVTNMMYMFADCSGLTSLDVSGFDTGNVTDISYMFSHCSGLTNLELSGFDTGNVTNMSYMFLRCSGLTSLDLSEFDTGNATNMMCMFDDCSGLTSLNLSGFNTENVTNMVGMFIGCVGLTTIQVGKDWNTDKVSSSDSELMFRNCTSLVGGDGTTFDPNYTDKTKAYAGIGGYLTMEGQETFDLQKAIDAVAASDNLGTADNPVEIQLPDEFVITTPITVHDKVYIRLTGGKLKVSDSFDVSKNYVFHIDGSPNSISTLYIKNVTIDCNNKAPHYSFFEIGGDLYIEDGVTYQNLNVQTGKDGAFYLNEGTLHVASGTVKVSGTPVYGGGNTYIEGGILQGTTCINTNGGYLRALLYGAGPHVSISGGELTASGTIVTVPEGTYSGGANVSGGTLKGSALLTQGSYCSAHVTGGVLDVNRLLTPNGKIGGPSGTSVYIGGDVALNVEFNICVYATSSLKKSWTFDCSSTDFNTVTFDVGGVPSVLVDPSVPFQEKSLIAGNGYELTQADFEKMTFTGVPETLTVYYNEETHSVNVKLKEQPITYDDLQAKLDAIAETLDGITTGYNDAEALYNSVKEYLSDTRKAAIETQKGEVKTALDGYIAQKNQLNSTLQTAATSDYSSLNTQIEQLATDVDAFKEGLVTELNNATEAVKAEAAEDLAEKLGAMSDDIYALQNQVNALNGQKTTISQQLGSYYFQYKASEELTANLATCDEQLSNNTSALTTLINSYNTLVSNSSISTVADAVAMYQQYYTLKEQLEAITTDVVTAQTLMETVQTQFGTSELNFPDEDQAFTIRPTALTTEIQLGYKNNRGFVLTSAGMMQFEQKEGADFYLKDYEGNYIVATAGKTTLTAGSKEEATVWTGKSLNDGNYTICSKDLSCYLAYSGVKVNSAITAQGVAYSWTIEESELDELQAFLNLLAEEEEYAEDEEEEDDLDTLVWKIPETEEDVYDPIVFPELPYIIKLVGDDTDRRYFPIPRYRGGDKRPANFHPIHIKPNSYVVFDELAFRDLVGGDHVLYVEGTVEIHVNVTILIENWEWFIHVGPTGRVIWRPTGDQKPNLKNEGTLDMEDGDLGELANTGTVNHKKGSIVKVVNRKTYYFDGGVINLMHNYGQHYHRGGTVLTAQNFAEGTYTMTGGYIWNTVVNTTETIFWNYGKFYFRGGYIRGYGSRLIYHAKGAYLYIDGGLFDFTNVKDYFIEAHDVFYIRGDYDYAAPVPMLIEPSVSIRILYKWIYHFNIVFIDGRPTPRYPLFYGEDFRLSRDHFSYIDWELPNKRWRWYYKESDNTIEPRDEEVQDEDDLQAYLDWLADNQEDESASTEEEPQVLDLSEREITITQPVVWPVGSHVYIKRGRFVPTGSWTYDHVFYVSENSTLRVEDVTIEAPTRFYVKTATTGRIYLHNVHFYNVVLWVQNVVNIYVTKHLTYDIYLYIPAAYLYEGFRIIGPSGDFRFDEADLEHIKIVSDSDEDWEADVDDDGYATLRKAIRSHTLTVGDATLATLYLDYPVTIPDEDDIMGVFYGKGIESEVLRLGKVKNIIPANTGVIIFANPGTYTFYESEEEGTALTDNVLKGSVQSQQVSDIDGTVLTLGRGTTGSFIGFYKYLGNTLAANKAYIVLDSNADIKELQAVLDDDATGILPIHAADNDTDVIYNLNGQRVKRATQGFYIVNGKKVFVR